MTHLSLSLLGHFKVFREDQTGVEFATDKARALLAYLAVERDHAHRRDYLAALLWPDQPEARARQNLRQALSSLRQTLGDSDALPVPLLLVSRETVQVNPNARAASDVAEFTALLEAVRRHTHRQPGTCLPCLRRMERMATLYTGDFLAHFYLSDSELFEEWALLKREWLHREALQALVALSHYYERRGDLDAARAYTQRQLALDPWREEAHRQLMRLLALDGERSTALAQYETCRRVLATEFGAEPAAETVELWGRISESANLQISKAANQPSSPPLPLPPSPFVGRDRECAELAKLLANPECRLVTLIGPGGIGKSRLALQVAENHRGVFADGVVFVSLTSIAHADALLHAIADALLPPAAPRDFHQLLAHVRGKELLLVLDNFEHLVDYGEHLSTLLHHARGLTLLVTSREKLRLQEEWLYPLEGLDYPASPADLRTAPETYSALALFRQQARRAQPRFELTPNVLPDAIRICALVQGLPLGIELAAAAIAEQPCAELADALAQTFDALKTTLRNAPARHHSLRAVFEHSWALLTAGQQRTFTALSVFAGSFDGEAAHAVAGVSAAELAALTAKSLLTANDARYFWHEATRQYATERLAEDVARAEALHVQHSAVFAARLARNATSAESFAALERDRGNLQAAWNWVSARAETDALAAMAQGLGEFYRWRGPAQEGLEIITAAVERLADRPPSPVQAELRIEEIQLLNLLSRYDEALPRAATVVALGQHLTAPQIEATGYFLEGQTLQKQGQSEAAQTPLEKALALARTLAGTEGQRLETKILSEMGNAAQRYGKQAQAQHYYEQALALCQSLADRGAESALRNNLGSLCWDQGDYDAAREQLARALQLYRELGNLPGEAKALNNLANVAADQRDYSSARQHYQQALEIHQATGNTHAQSGILNNLGALYWDLGRYAEAREAYRHALTLYRESGNRQAAGETLANLSLLELRLGNPQAALPLAQEALRASEECHDPTNLANTCSYLGKIQTTLRCWDEAEHWYRRALTLRQALPHLGRQLELTAELAYLTHKRGDAPQALREIEPVLAALDDALALSGAEEPYQVYWACYEILHANGDERAPTLLETARQRLHTHAASISDPELRRSFLENVPIHRQIAGSAS